MKRILSLSCAILMILMSAVSPISAYADNSVESAMAQSIRIENDGLMSSGTEISSSKKYEYNGKKYYGDGKELYVLVRDKLDRMESGFKINYFSKTQIHPNTIFGISSFRENALGILENIIMGATDNRLSVSCTDGDYSRWSMSAYEIRDFTIVSSEKGNYCYSFKLYPYYRCSKSQEKELSQRIKEIVSSIRQMGMSDYDTLRYIHDYICDSTTYDYSAINNTQSNEIAFTAYGALVKGSCVCQGYALAFYRICRELGYRVRFVSSDPEIGCHAWNLIMLDSKYYFVDCTWDDGCNEGIRQESPYTFFLVNYNDLKAYDNGSYAHTLYSSLYGDKYFTDNFRNYFSQSSYNTDNYPLMSSARISISGIDYKYNGSQICPQAYVADAYGNTLTENVDYTVTYSDNVKCGLGSVNINGIGTYQGMNSSRSFNILPSKTTGIKIKSSGDTSFTVSWNNDGSAKHNVQIYKNGKWSNAGTSYGSTYKISGLSPAKSYKVRVKPVENINRIEYSGVYSSSFTACTTPKKISLTSASKSGKILKVRWNKTACDGYQIQYGTNKSMKNAKSVKIKKPDTVSKAVKGLKTGKKYYVRIRAYKTIKSSSGKTEYYYGQWSSKKAV